MELDISKVGGYGTGYLGNVASDFPETRMICISPKNPADYIELGGVLYEIEGNVIKDWGVKPPVGTSLLFTHLAANLPMNFTEPVSEKYTDKLGKWEVRKITGYDGTDVILDQAPDLDLDNYMVTVHVFLEYENLTLNAGERLFIPHIASGAYQIILPIKVRDTLTLNGGIIDLSYNGSVGDSFAPRPLTPQEINGLLDSDAQAGLENSITKDRFLHSGVCGALFLVAKNISVTNTDSRIGSPYLESDYEKQLPLISGVQYCRGAEDSPNCPKNIFVDNETICNATNRGGPTILIACETFTGFFPELIAKYRIWETPNWTGTEDPYINVKTLARCYIACKNPPSTLIEDGMLYYLDADTAEENENRLQGFEIQIAEQQITETVTFTAAAPFEILQQTAGQFLDYKYNLRIESITQRGILYTCRCCTNLEEILYSQLEYSVPEVSRQQRTWHWVGGHKTYDEPERANASGHVEAIAGALGISYKNQFDDFVSTVEVERGGSTYADTIRELFGWSARIPTLLINAFIRDDCLYVIQRGHEERVIDISNAKITLPIFTRELVRTYWGETTYINTEVRTVSCIVNSFQESDYENDGTDTGGAGMFTIREPSAPLRQHEITKTATGSIEKSYHYNENGLLVKTIETTKNTEEETTGQTITVYEYEGDGDYLKEETMTIYDKTGAITEKRTITYSPTGAGQASAVGKNSDGETFLNTIKDIPPSEMPTPYALNKNFHDLQEADPEFQAQKQARQQERLVPGIVPFDTSFPIVGDDKLIEITNAIKDLNRRTKETVTLTLYDYEHLIDFNDRILLYGAEYFLVSNTLTTTPHVRDQQSLVLVRWY